jgi:FkbM family methyltransferase
MLTRRRPLDWRGVLVALLAAGVAVVFYAAGYLTPAYLERREAARLASRAPSPDDIKRPVLDDELQPFLARLGQPRYSSHDEELFVRDFFADRRDGVFVDVGASHYKDRSNTYYLESVLGWSGLAIDPLVEFADGYREHRPKTLFFPMFVSDKSDQRATLYVGNNSLFSSAERTFTDSFTNVQRTLEASTITLDDLLASQGIDRVDFVSMDIELHEPQALAGFTLQKYRPALVCIEAHPEVRQQILDYFAARGYVVVGKYMRADPQNLWFAPAR